MAVTRFAFKLSDGANYIDLAQAMSLVQRTMVRQKQIFTVLGGQIVDNVGGQAANNLTAAIKVSTAPNLWYIRAAINRGFAAWKQQRAKALDGANLENSNHSVGKFADFKLSLSGVGSGSNVLPHYTGGGTVSPMAAPGEWSTASVTDEMGQEKHMKIVGDHTGAYYGLTKGWLVTRAIPDSEHEPDMLDLDGNAVLDYKEDFLNLLNETADGQPERLTLLYEDNDNAPFAVRDIYGDINSADNLQLQSLCYLSGNNPSSMLPGFKALCGLIKVDVDSNATGPILFLDVHNTPEGF